MTCNLPIEYFYFNIKQGHKK